jgi:integrase
MPLKDIEIKNLKPRDKPYKAADGQGLFLLINPATSKNPAGSKLWRQKYRFGGKERLLSHGTYPKVSLEAARRKRDNALEQLEAGQDPAAEKQAEKRKRHFETANAFQVVANEFLENKTRLWSDRHRENAKNRLKYNIFPALGHRPIAQITGPELLVELRKIERRGAHEMAHRIRALCSQVFRYGVACGVCERDPASDLRGALVPVRSDNMPVIELEELPELLVAIDRCEEAPACRDRQTRLATQILVLTFVRTIELRQGLWSQVKWDKGLWEPAVEAMKMRRPHIVPLAPQTLALLEELHQLTGRSPYMFPGEGRKGIMSENTILYGLYALGYRGRMCGHGFRSLASTILNEAGYNPDHIELQLAHQEENDSRRAYNHAKWLHERREMMNWYATYLDELRKGAFIEPRAFRRPAT